MRLGHRGKDFMARRRLVVLGTLAGYPYGGMAWMHMQIAAGLQRLGPDVYYFEVTLHGHTIRFGK